MNFQKVLGEVVGQLDATGLHYALIGGFAMAIRGVQRATMDLDFILLLEDMEQADGILRRAGYQRVFQSENVSHYVSPDREWGRIDILHAFRRPSLGMLARAALIRIDDDLTIRVVQVEDLIGLKVQALTNDPERAEEDWRDIHLLLRAARDQARKIDWQLVTDYLQIFHLESRLPELQRIHGQAD